MPTAFPTVISRLLQMRMNAKCILHKPRQYCNRENAIVTKQLGAVPERHKLAVRTSLSQKRS
jgi:hypothetical protein